MVRGRDRQAGRETDRQTDRQTERHRHMITPQFTKWLIKSEATKPSPVWLVYEGEKLTTVSSE